MIVTRVRHEGHIFLARIEDDMVVLLAKEDPHGAADIFRDALASGADLTGTGRSLPLEDVRLLAPTRRPGKLLAVGNNYLTHARESGHEAPPAPIVFAKATTSIIGPNDHITFSEDQSTEVDYEGELAVVIGRRTSRVSAEEASASIFGYTVCNDVSARDAQFSDGQWVRGKSFDSFAPIGPWVVTADACPGVHDAAIRTMLNETLVQDGRTSQMIFSATALIAYISRFITLEPADVIATGTPEGVGFARVPQIFLRDGDVVQIEVEGIGSLRNPVTTTRDDLDRSTPLPATVAATGP